MPITIGEVELDIMRISKIFGAILAVVVGCYQSWGYASEYLDKRIDRKTYPIQLAANIHANASQVSFLEIKITIKRRELAYLITEPAKNAVVINGLNNDIRWLEKQKADIQGAKITF